jgi:hypothetical protein
MSSTISNIKWNNFINHHIVRICNVSLYVSTFFCSRMLRRYIDIAVRFYWLCDIKENKWHSWKWAENDTSELISQHNDWSFALWQKFSHILINWIDFFRISFRCDESAIFDSMSWICFHFFIASLITSCFCDFNAFFKAYIYIFRFSFKFSFSVAIFTEIQRDTISITSAVTAMISLKKSFSIVKVARSHSANMCKTSVKLISNIRSLLSSLRIIRWFLWRFKFCISIKLTSIEDHINQILRHL